MAYTYTYNTTRLVTYQTTIVKRPRTISERTKSSKLIKKASCVCNEQPHKQADKQTRTKIGNKMV